MPWATIRAEPLEIDGARFRDDVLCYLFHLPIIRDGRLSFVQFIRNPEKAIVLRYRSQRSKNSGYLRFIDNQWICEWTASSRIKLASQRLIGSRFAIGDTIGLKPVGGPLGLFQVSEHLPGLAAG